MTEQAQMIPVPPRPRHLKISTNDWIGTPDNPRQRDTERHARVAIQWLQNPMPTHYDVHAAQLPDGSLIKLDGHTRAFLWETNQIPKPPDLTVTVYPVKDKREAADLYVTFDNIKAAETAPDQTFGAMREIGFHPKSRLLKNCRFGNAIKHATIFEAGLVPGGRTSILPYEAVRHWKKELAMLDDLNAPLSFSGSLVCAFLMTVRRRGDRAIEFWSKYTTDDAVRTGRHRDPVAALQEAVANKALGGISSSKRMMSMVGRALSCVEAYVNGQLYTGTPKPTAPETYLIGMRK